jgi:hypothetical protein
MSTICQRHWEGSQREAGLIIPVATHMRGALLAGNYPVAKQRAIRCGVEPGADGGSQQLAAHPYLLLEAGLLAAGDS